MKKVNSLSGGKTSSYIAANYPADHDVFALVRIEDENCKFKDEKIRRKVEDRIQAPFIATAEDDTIIYTILDLEQFIGREISWVTGKTFDQVIRRGRNENGDLAIYLPNPTMRFCTTEMKLKPIFNWWKNEISEPIEMRIGFRANEHRRAKTMNSKLNKNGLLEFKDVVGKTKTGNRNRWATFEWQKPTFPLIENGLYKDNIEAYWKNKPVRFAWTNNCIGCFHREIHLLKKMQQLHPEKFDWFIRQEEKSRRMYTDRSWNLKIAYKEIKNWNPTFDMFEEDFNDCDSGYCGL